MLFLLKICHSTKKLCFPLDKIIKAKFQIPCIYGNIYMCVCVNIYMQNLKIIKSLFEFNIKLIIVLTKL